MNPEDLADILGGEDEDDDEDAKWVTGHLLLSYDDPCGCLPHADALKRSLLTVKQKL
jgi:hypothetical protein